MPPETKIQLQPGDALIIVDLQNDFLPGGALAVPRGDEVVPVLNDYIARFEKKHLPVFATRDWHPANHCSFKTCGGIWPAHCVAETNGAAFASQLRLPKEAIVVSKATEPGAEAYSGFVGTALEKKLRHMNARRVFVGGLATDYCVLSTVKDALKAGFETFLLRDGCRAVNVKPDDGRKAELEMEDLGARSVELAAIRV